MEHINRVLEKVRLSAQLEKNEKNMYPALKDIFKDQVIVSCSQGSTKGCAMGCIGS